MKRAARAPVVLLMAIAVVAVTARPAWAIRLLVTEDPAPTGPGKVELELGGEYTRQGGEIGRAHV